MIRNKHNGGFRATSIEFLVIFAISQLSAIVVVFGVPTTTVTPSASTSTTAYGNPLTERKHERNCKALCEHCGCLGFYCGEECICECNDDNSDTECIHTMQKNARALNSPFEILIQGPSTNRFVRNAQQFEQKHELVARSVTQTKTIRNRRPTITIYKPLLGEKLPALSFNSLDIPSSQVKISELPRHKRSVDHLEWFNDFASSLVRPSPLGSRGKKQREVKRQAATVESPPRSHREPWFLEQAAPLLNRPAPLYRRQQQNVEEEEMPKTSKKKKQTRPTSFEEDFEPQKPEKKSTPEIRPLRDALQVVERIPRVLQDTVTHLAADNNSGDVFSLNIMNDVLPKKIERKAKSHVKRRQSKRVRGYDVEKPAVRATLAPITLPPPAPLAPRGLLFPWLRQRRLMRMRGSTP